MRKGCEQQQQQQVGVFQRTDRGCMPDEGINCWNVKCWKVGPTHRRGKGWGDAVCAGAGGGTEERLWHNQTSAHCSDVCLFDGLGGGGG